MRWKLIVLTTLAGLMGPAAMAAESLDAALAQIFEDEAGHWEGSCVQRTAAGIEEITAIFDIRWNEQHGHSFAGHYGDAPVAGRSEIEDGFRIDVVEGAPAPSRARIEAARREAADDYRYVVSDDDGRSTITRLGARQVLVAADPEDDSEVQRICTYTRTGPPA